MSADLGPKVRRKAPREERAGSVNEIQVTKWQGMKEIKCDTGKITSPGGVPRPRDDDGKRDDKK
jgi:hypothetical protein